MKFHLQAHQKPLILLNVVAASLALGAILLLLQLDTLIHVTLYDFGLQFNYEWAVPYWTVERVALGFLGAIAGINIFSVLNIMLRSTIPTPVKSKVQPQLGSIRVKREAPEARQQELSSKIAGPEPVDERRLRDVDEDGVEIAALPLVCNKCGKVFTQPLCMFDFKSGKPRLVNVCPYCNAVLAVSGNSKE